MPIYLDHNATTPLDPDVLEAMLPYMGSLYGNPSSVHRYGRLTRSAIDQARQQVAELVGAQASEVVFTSGGTESNNLAIKGCLQPLEPARLAISQIEHASLIAAAKDMEAAGWNLDMIPVNTSGEVIIDNLQQIITADTRLLSVMAANNETGVLQDIASITAMARSINERVICHSDACQLAGKQAINFADMALDLMSLSAHKMYGPQGIGALIVKSHIDIRPQLAGGGHERQRRSGTENVAAIVGFGAAAALSIERLDQRQRASKAMQEQLLSQLGKLSGVQVFAYQAKRLANTVMFAVDGIDGETLLMQLDMKGFAVSSGSACNSTKAEPSHVLLAMGVDPQVARGAVRVSLGEQNTSQHIDSLVKAITEIKSNLSE